MVKKRASPLIVAIVALIATYNSAGFYFWHDDFSSFYSHRIGVCIHGWPYVSFCPYLYYLDKIFGYSPRAYFGLGIILAILCSITLYYLLKSFIDSQTSLFGSLLFATFFIGNNVFLEAWDPIVSFSSLLFLFFTIYWFIKKKDNLRGLNLFVWLFMFGLSLSFLHARSFMHVFPILFVSLIHKNKLFSKKNLRIQFTALIFYFFVFFILPFWFKNLFIGMFKDVEIEQGTLEFRNIVNAMLNKSNISFTLQDLFQRVVHFVTTFGSFLLTDSFNSKFLILAKPNAEVLRLLLGMVIIFFITLSTLLIRRKNRTLFSIRLYGVLWVISMYFPYGLRAGWRIESYHRYLIFILPGLIFIWISYKSAKYWKFVSFVLIIFGLLQTIFVLSQHQKTSLDRKNFYKQLHGEINELKSGSVVYFDVNPNVSLLAGDFFRVGLLPSEASLATEYAINYKSLMLFIDPMEFYGVKVTDNYDLEKIYTFYYDGQTLINTSQDSRGYFGKSITREIGSYGNTEFRKSNNYWIGSNNGIDFDIEKYYGYLPAKLTISIQSQLANIRFPYRQGCSQFDECGLINNLDNLKGLADSQNLKRDVSVSVSDFDKANMVNNLLDGDINTYWFANRKNWHSQAERPELIIDFGKLSKFGGFIFWSKDDRWKPSNFEVIVDGVPSKYFVELESEYVKLLPEIHEGREIKVKIINTLRGDAPLVNEVDILSVDSLEIDMENLFKLKNFPVYSLENEIERTKLKNFLESGGANACLEWDAGFYGRGEISFNLISDSRLRKYDFFLPSFGQEKVQFHIGCLNYPVNVFLSDVEVKY